MVKVLPVIFATVVIFGSGVVTGGLLVRETLRPKSNSMGNMIPPPGLSPGPWQLQRKEFLVRMERQMNLSSEQRQKVEKIIRESQERTKPLWEFISPDLREELEKVRVQIRGELTPAQQVQFDDLLRTKPLRQNLETQRDEQRKRRKTPDEGSSKLPSSTSAVQKTTE
ncbi:MAG: hypothetical protein H7X97_08650 [Opitutaceae bacterium]|nr:hypothetical protein [Verrucomicrobiales bacterium]